MSAISVICPSSQDAGLAGSHSIGLLMSADRPHVMPGAGASHSASGLLRVVYSREGDGEWMWGWQGGSHPVGKYTQVA